jgi:hypothetical protein
MTLLFEALSNLYDSQLVELKSWITRCLLLPYSVI